MKVLNINFNYSVKEYKAPTLKMTKPLQFDTVTFCAKKKDLRYYLENLDEKNWPERMYSRAKEITETLPEDSWPELYELHDEVYAPLREAKTLEEAKELYPEFESVRPLSEIDVQKGKLGQMKRGEIEQPEGDIALHLLKYVYKQTENETLSSSFVFNNAEKFNIKLLSQKYTTTLNSKHMKKRWQDEGYRQRRSDETKELWQDRNYKQRMDEIHQSEEFRQKVSAAAKEAWRDPKVIQAHSNAAKELWRNEEYRKALHDTRSTEEFKARLSKALKKSWEDPKRIEKMSQFMLELWQDEEYIRKQAEAKTRPEVIKAHSDALKKLWQNPDYRAMKDELLALSWEYSGFVIDVMKDLCGKHPESLSAYSKKKSGIRPTEAQKTLAGAFYRDVYSTPGTREARCEAYQKAREEYERRHKEGNLT